MLEFKIKSMKIKKILEGLIEEGDEKQIQQKTDAIIGFFIVEIPKAIGKGFTETYSWMKDGITLAYNNMSNNYKEKHDIRTFSKLFKENTEQGINFCETDYKAGDVVCKYSKEYYDKSFMREFCNHSGYGPDLSVVIKKNGSHFHRGYCRCSEIKRQAISTQKETLINTN